MRITRDIFKSALIISALFLLSIPVFSQDVPELLPGSDRYEFDEITGIHRIIGNVNFLYQGHKMYCDSAHYNRKKNTVRAYGHVHINKKDTLNLFCDSLFYNGRTRKSKLWGNVRVRDSEYKLTTDTLDYDASKSRGSYHYGGRVVSILNNEVLTSKVGYFYPDEKNFYFSKDVKYKGDELEMETDTLQYIYALKKTFFYGPTNIYSKDATMYCESGWYNTNSGEGTLSKNAWLSREKEYFSGDTLLYNPELKQAIGIGNVYYVDSLQNTSFKGDYAFSSDTLDYSFLTGHALAIKEMDNDTLYIHGDTLYMQTIDSSKIIQAYYGARIYSTDMQARADSIVFNESEERIELHVEPIVWSKDAELKGEFIDMHVTDSTIHKINIYKQSTILMEVKPEEYYNQIAGKDITAFFKDNDLNKALVEGNAITIFYPEDEEKTDSTVTKKRLGMNRIYSSELRIDIDSNEIVGITYMDEPDGAFYPLEKIAKGEQFIKNFNWKIALRPESIEDLFKD